MAVIFTDVATVRANAQARLVAVRQALTYAKEFSDWLSAYAQGDLVALGMSAEEVSVMFSAFADAAELNTLYTGGGLGSYTLPYNFSASMRRITGPLP